MWQLINSFIPYVLLWFVMYQAMQVSYWLTLAIVPLASGFVVRLFIIQHDCGHGSFFRSRRANDAVGFVLGLISLTPYHYWRYTHAVHHASSGDLDRRGTGDVWLMTVAEYQAASWFQKLRFRLYRNPICLFGIGPFYMFFIHYRFAHHTHGSRWQWSVQKNNLTLFAWGTALSLLMGWREYLMIQVPVTMGAAILGVWLFYVQHQFPGVRWAHRENWSYEEAALHGSSFYKLPRILQWFSGNIGFHHVHHLSPRIPNYYLDRCHYENPILHSVNAMGLRKSFRSVTYRLWDEDKQELVRIGNGFW